MNARPVVQNLVVATGQLVAQVVLVGSESEQTECYRGLAPAPPTEVNSLYWHLLSADFTTEFSELCCYLRLLCSWVTHRPS